MTDAPSDEQAEAAAELLPCPFCGGAGALRENDWCEPPMWSVNCTFVNCLVGSRDGATQAEAIAAWNKRPSPPPVLSNWRGIETAPKDGTRIIAYCPNHPDHGPIQRITWWRSAKDKASYVGWGEFNERHWPPTHWRPLDPPPEEKVPLSCKDPTAQDLLWEYAQRHRAVDAEFSADLESALKVAGYDPVLRAASNWREIREECARVADELATEMDRKQSGTDPDTDRYAGLVYAEGAAALIAERIRALPAPPGAGGDEDRGALSDRGLRSDEHSTSKLVTALRAIVDAGASGDPVKRAGLYLAAEALLAGVAQSSATCGKATSEHPSAEDGGA